MLIDTRRLSGNATAIVNATNQTEMVRFRTAQDATRVMARAVSTGLPCGHVATLDMLIATAANMGVKVVQRRK